MGGRRAFIVLLLVSAAIHAAVILSYSVPEPAAEPDNLEVLVTMVVPAEAIEETVQEAEEAQPPPEMPPAPAEVPTPTPQPAQVSEETADDFDDMAIVDLIAVSAIAKPVDSAMETPPQAAQETVYDPLARANYAQVLASWLAAHKRYPSAAIRQNQQGECMLRLIIHRDGNVIDSSIERSSGHALLDREALAMVRRANPFPPAPSEVLADEQIFLIPVAFTLN